MVASDFSTSSHPALGPAADEHRQTSAKAERGSSRFLRLMKREGKHRPDGNRKEARSVVARSNGAVDRLPRHRTIIGVDIVSFGGREEYFQNHVRISLYEILREAFAESGTEWPAAAWVEDRGDGALIALPSDIPPQRAVDPLVPYLTAGLRRNNRVMVESARISLRMAVHAGYVARDDHGLTGEAIVHLFRLLEAPSFRDAVAYAQPTLGLVVSQSIYESVIRPGLGLIDPGDYTKLPITNKETVTDAWIHLLGLPATQH